MSEAREWIKLIYEYPSAAPLFVLLFAVGIVWLYGRYRWKKGSRGFHQLAVPLVYMGASFLLPAALLAYYLYLYRGLPSAFNSSETGILVAEISGDVDRKQQSKYARAILDQTEKSPHLHGLVKVRLIERPLP